ncbi:hypothetical protein SAMN05216466_102598 [Paraburkholderia phenazinium]|jgi:hypothetical protein|uniref:Uncharacterized protein n=1 Tax=Paraburkholderia phenazinium TaxID=60549 RepID=A0A1G7SP71_9BURK|nr:hypothetical protein SAMN05216466_102598 [Paraburkholderia phenazinium]
MPVPVGKLDADPQPLMQCRIFRFSTTIPSIVFVLNLLLANTSLRRSHFQTAVWIGGAACRFFGGWFVVSVGRVAQQGRAFGRSFRRPFRSVIFPKPGRR